jgi:hypothetical protein
MEKTIYNFLDTYVGGGINISKGAVVYNPYTFSPCMGLFINSDSGVEVITIKDNVMSPSIKLIFILKSFFIIDKYTSFYYIQKWFSDNRKSELIKKIDADFKDNQFIDSKCLKWNKIIKSNLV